MNIRNYAVPVVGKATKVNTSYLTVDTDHEFSTALTDIYWWNVTDNTGSDKYFREGKQYYLVAEFRPRDGYFFEWDKTQQKNYTGTATFKGVKAQVAYEAYTEDGPVFRMRSQLYTPTDSVAPEIIPHPVVNEDEKVVVLSDGTKLFYDEKIELKYYSDVYYTGEQLYEKLRALPATLDKDKVYYIHVIDRISYQQPVNNKSFTFEGVNVILDVSGGVTHSGNFTDRTLFYIKDCGLFAMINSSEKAEYSSSKVRQSSYSSGTVTSYQSETETVLIQLIKEGSTEAAYEAAVTGNSASFKIEGVETGIYVMKVMKKNHVTREYTVVVLDTAVTQDAKIHLLGDINGDGRVNTSDVGKANAHAKKTSLLTGYELACADVNGDGRVNTSDVGKLNAHAKKTSLLW